MVEVHKTQESSNISKVAGLQLVGNGGSLLVIHTYATGFNDHAEVFNAIAIKLIFLGLQVQIVFVIKTTVRCGHTDRNRNIKLREGGARQQRPVAA